MFAFKMYCALNNNFKNVKNDLFWQKRVKIITFRKNIDDNHIKNLIMYIFNIGLNIDHKFDNIWLSFFFF